MPGSVWVRTTNDPSPESATRCGIPDTATLRTNEPDGVNTTMRRFPVSATAMLPLASIPRSSGQFSWPSPDPEEPNVPTRVGVPVMEICLMTPARSATKRWFELSTTAADGLWNPKLYVAASSGLNVEATSGTSEKTPDPIRSRRDCPCMGCDPPLGRRGRSLWRVYPPPATRKRCSGGALLSNPRQAHPLFPRRTERPEDHFRGSRPALALRHEPRLVACGLQDKGIAQREREELEIRQTVLLGAEHGARASQLEVLL